MDRFVGHDLTCIRGDRLVFAGLDFALETGGALLLVGPNGSGKSSLLRLMAGLLAPAAGTLAWNGEPVAADREAHGGRLHYVGHLDAVKPVLSVLENVAFWGRLRPGGSRVAAEEALTAFGIAHLANVPGRFLSAGQRRRVNLARILAAPAPLWLLDEPTTALDRAAIAGLEGAIARHRKGGGMVVAATHAPIALAGARTLDLAAFETEAAA
jgi:heme exporter protein A